MERFKGVPPPIKVKYHFLLILSMTLGIPGTFPFNLKEKEHFFSVLEKELWYGYGGTIVWMFLSVTTGKRWS